jgi:hypothetical protein
MANKKLKKEELDQIQEIQNRMSAIKTELGQLALAEIDLKSRKSSVEQYLNDTKDLETTLLKGLEDKYGQGSIDLDKGEFVATAKAKQAQQVLPTVE